MDLQIHTRSLGGMDVSEVALGTKGWGGCYGNAISPQEAEELLDFLQSHSCTLIDTSPTYGPAQDPTAVERLVGSALAACSGKAQVATKFDGSLTDAGAIRASLEGSLERLGQDKVALFLQDASADAASPAVVAPVMEELAGEGLIEGWGMVDASEEALRQAHALFPVIAIENRYSMLYRATEALLPVCEELGVGLLAHSPLGNAFLTCSSEEDYEYGPDDIRSGMPLFGEEGYEANEGLLDLVEGMAAWKYATNAHVALRWLLCQSPLVVPVFGTTNKRHADADICSVMLDLNPNDLTRMKAYLKDFPFADGFNPRP